MEQSWNNSTQLEDGLWIRGRLIEGFNKACEGAGWQTSLGIFALMLYADVASRRSEHVRILPLLTSTDAVPRSSRTE